MELKRVIGRKGFCWAGLLIVPYGIETCMEDIYYDFEIAFNRTLWN